jgi:hypothetical protein
VGSSEGEVESRESRAASSSRGLDSRL